MTWFGWYDPDRKKPARTKLADAVDRYVEKHQRDPRICLTSHPDADELADPKSKGPAPSLEVHARNYIPRGTYYIGEADPLRPALMTEMV